MSKPPKSPPRFVPTLTQVVHDASPAPLPEVAVPALPPPLPPPPVPVPVPTEVLPQIPEDFEELLVHRLMQRVDVGLDQRLRDAIATVVQEQTRSVLPRLREEVESVVRQVVYEAVADELASKAPTPFVKT